MSSKLKTPLHDLDIWLSQIAICNIRWNLDSGKIRDRIGSLPQALADCLIGKTGSNSLSASIPRYLLSWDELDKIIFAVDSLPLPDRRDWRNSDIQLGEITLCTGEIRRRLPATDADRWSQAAHAYNDKLQRSRLSLAAGFEVVRDWTDLIRKYLEALGTLELIPRPEGGFPTPTNPQPSEALVSQHEISAFTYTELLRQAIQDHPDGKKAKADEIIDKVGMANQLGLELLRQLEVTGEFCGFKRRRAARYNKARE